MKYIVVPSLEEFELLTADGRFDENLDDYAVGRKVFHKDKGQGTLSRVMAELNLLGVVWDGDPGKATEMVQFDKTKIKLLKDEENEGDNKG